MKRKQRNGRKVCHRLGGLAAVVAAVAATPVVHAGQSGDQVTISLSGATFMRNFTTSAGISLLTPGSPTTDITLLSGAGGAPVVYKAASGGTTSVQLAPINLGGVVTPNPATGLPAGTGDPAVTSANYAGLRVEWHEQGSIEGVLELINDQVRAVPSVGLTNRNPSTGNPTWVNRNSFTTHPNTINGYTLNTSIFNPAFAGPTYNDADPKRPGTNIQGGQNRVQMAISDVHARQGFAVGSSSTAAWFARPGQNGYGKGNQALGLAAPGNIQGLGFGGVRHELNDGSVANMNAGDINPNTGAAYGAGPWNTAGVDNLHNVTVANGGLTFIANPATGMTRINRSNSVWLHSTGRLANGADFNVATRDEFSGTINTGVTNVGLDVSWATGENDNGNGNAADGGTAQTRIGSSIKFSNKTSGSSQVRPTVQNARMGFGHLTSSESVIESFNSRSRPVRVLEYRDDDNDVADGSNNALPADRRNNLPFADPSVGSDPDRSVFNGFTRLSAKSLVTGSYTLRTNQTYITVKDPKAAFAGDSAAAWAARNDSPTTGTGTGIKGDNHNVIDLGSGPQDYGNDVFDFRENIFKAVANFPAASVANPADELLARGFILTQLVEKTKTVDGLNQDFNNPSFNIALAWQGFAIPGDPNSGPGSGTLASPASDSFLGSTLVTPFNAGDPRLVMQGTGGLYGNNQIGTGAATPVGGSIPINANNWLFGDFDQTGAKEGIRDFSDLTIAQQAQAALFTSGLGVDWNVIAASNATAVAGVPVQLGFAATKGDLIVLGDYDADGDFDGQDLYRYARGAALADNTGSTTLTNASGAELGDMLRNGVLRKNAALDQLDSTATAQQKIDASANLANDPTGANAFNKRDVNRDGLVNLADGVTSDKFLGKDYRKLDDQLAATGDVRVGDLPKPISLVDAELTDTGNIDQSDLDVLNAALVGTGSETWTGTLVKSGAGSISAAYTGGTFKVNPGAVLEINAGTVNVGGTVDMFTDNTGTATNGNHVSVVSNSVTSLNIIAGSKAVGTITGVGKTTVSTGATLSADYVRQSVLEVAGNLNIRPNSSNASVATSLSVTGLGKIDLADTKLITANPLGTWDGSAYTGMSGLVDAGRGNASNARWDGVGIVTSDTRAVNNNDLVSIGTAKVGAIKGIADGVTTTFAGQTVLGSDTIVMTTWGGDANLDGKINIDDYGQIDFNVSSSGSVFGWYNGDFNYDGKINIDDYGIIDFNVNAQGAAFPVTTTAGGDLLEGGVAAVPEPGSVGVILTALGLSLPRVARRRRR